MQKTKTFKSGWNRLKIPDWFPDYICGLNDSIRLGMLYRALVMREPGYTSLLYSCNECNHLYSSTKIQEEYASCNSCGSPNIISTVKRSQPKPHEGSIRDLISYTISQLSSLKSKYNNKPIDIGIKTFGFCKVGYYFQLTGNDAIRCEDQSFKSAILKASLMQAFLWDFDFDWNKFNIRNIKIYNVLSILN
jgi:DNA-directed RNA polymerase subunit RPC12/RpoP